MPARLVLRALALGTMIAGAPFGCSLDWQVRLDDVDAGDANEGAADGGSPQDGADDPAVMDAPAGDAVECCAP